MSMRVDVACDTACISHRRQIKQLKEQVASLQQNRTQPLQHAQHSGGHGLQQMSSMARGNSPSGMMASLQPMVPGATVRGRCYRPPVTKRLLMHSTACLYAGDSCPAAHAVLQHGPVHTTRPAHGATSEWVHPLQIAASHGPLKPTLPRCLLPADGSGGTKRQHANISNQSVAFAPAVPHAIPTPCPHACVPLFFFPACASSWATWC